MQKIIKTNLRDLLLPNNTNCFREDLIEFDQVVENCSCTVCTDKKINRMDESLTIVKRIVVPGDTKNDNDSDGGGNCEKIKIKIPFDPNANMGKQVTDYKELIGNNSHVLLALFTGGKSGSTPNVTIKTTKKIIEHSYKFNMRIQDGGQASDYAFLMKRHRFSYKNSYNFEAKTKVQDEDIFQLNKMHVLSRVLLPYCTIDIKKKEVCSNYLCYHYLNQVELGEIAFFFVQASIHSSIFCHLFGPCSLLKFKKQSNLDVCFCERNLIIHLDLVQKNGQSKIENKKFYDYFPNQMQNRYQQVKFNINRITFDANEEQKAQNQKDITKNQELRRIQCYMYLLIEQELKKLLKEASGEENFRHFYKIDKSYPNALQIKDIQINLERHYNIMTKFFGSYLNDESLEQQWISDNREDNATWIQIRQQYYPLHLIEYYTGRLIDIKYKVPSIKHDVDLFVSYYIHLANAYAMSGMINDSKYILKKGNEFKEHFLKNSQLSKVPQTPSGDPEEFNPNVVFKINKKDMVENNTKQLEQLQNRVENSLELTESPKIENESCPNHQNYFQELFFNFENTVIKQIKLVGDKNIIPRIGDEVQITLVVQFITQYQYLQKSLKGKDKTKGITRRNSIHQFQLLTKQLLTQEDDNILLSMCLGELSTFWIRGMEKTSEKYCKIMNMLILNGNEDNLNEQHKITCCCMDSVVLQVQLMRIESKISKIHPIRIDQNCKNIIDYVEGHKLVANSLVSHKKQCCDQIAQLIYRQLINYIMPLIFKPNDQYHIIQPLIEDLFIKLIQNMCIIFNKHGNFYKTIKWIGISINIKQTAKLYYLRAMAYNSLQKSEFNQSMKNQDITKAHELEPKDSTITKEFQQLKNVQITRLDFKKNQNVKKFAETVGNSEIKVTMLEVLKQSVSPQKQKENKKVQIVKKYDLEVSQAPLESKNQKKKRKRQEKLKTNTGPGDQKDDEFFDAFVSVSKKGQKLVQKKEVQQEKDNVSEYSLNKKEKAFIKQKVSLWQDYLKKVKCGQLGFSKRELSKINSQTIHQKCIDIEFDEDVYNKWIAPIMRWDQFKMDHVEKYKSVTKRKKSDCSIISEEDTDKPQKTQDEGWMIKETDGEKHSKRIRVLNAKKRNEQFDIKYEESKEEREERQELADQKRKLIIQQQAEIQLRKQKDEYFSRGRYTNYQSKSTSRIQMIPQDEKSETDEEDKISQQVDKQIEDYNEMRRKQIQMQMRNIQTEKGDSGIYCDEDYYESDDESDDLDENGQYSHIEEIEGELDQEQVWFGSKKQIPDKNKKSYSQSEVSYYSSSQVYNDSKYDTETDQSDSQQNSLQQKSSEKNHSWRVQNDDYKTPIKNPVKLTSTVFKPFTIPNRKMEKEKEEEKEIVKEETVVFKQHIYPPKYDFPMAKVVKLAPPKVEKVDPKAPLVPANYKTIMCRRYEQFGKCTYIGCTYAHGQKELNFGINKLSAINEAQNAAYKAKKVVVNPTQFSTVIATKKTMVAAPASPVPPPKPSKPVNLLSTSAEPVKSTVTASSTKASNKYDNDDYDDYDDYYDEEYEKPVFDPKKNPLYKTSMCKNVVKTGFCTYEHTCIFAHSKKELKKAPEFKTNNNYYNQHEPLHYEKDF